MDLDFFNNTFTTYFLLRKVKGCKWVVQGTPLASSSLMRLMQWDGSVVPALDKAGGGGQSIGAWPQNRTIHLHF